MRETVFLKVNPVRPDGCSISYAAALLRKGALVAFPTETVYGLGVNIKKRRAMAALIRVKKRPKGKEFTVHIASKRAPVAMGCRMTVEAAALVKKFWPGPLTIVLKSRAGKKIGFRMPANAIALGLIKAAGVPIAAPSANLSGNKPPTSAKEVLGELSGKIDLVLDGGRTKVGIESTVVDLTASPPKVLREGAISKWEILKICRR